MCMACAIWSGLDRLVFGATIADSSRFVSQIMIPAKEVARRTDLQCVVSTSIRIQQRSIGNGNEPLGLQHGLKGLLPIVGSPASTDHFTVVDDVCALIPLEVTVTVCFPPDLNVMLSVFVPPSEDLNL
jgi:hypothetical protein